MDGVPRVHEMSTPYIVDPFILPFVLLLSMLASALCVRP